MRRVTRPPQKEFLTCFSGTNRLTPSYNTSSPVESSRVFIPFFERPGSHLRPRVAAAGNVGTSAIPRGNMFHKTILSPMDTPVFHLLTGHPYSSEPPNNSGPSDVGRAALEPSGKRLRYTVQEVHKGVFCKHNMPSSWVFQPGNSPWAGLYG